MEVSVVFGVAPKLKPVVLMPELDDDFDEDWAPNTKPVDLGASVLLTPVEAVVPLVPNTNVDDGAVGCLDESAAELAVGGTTNMKF